MRLFSSLLIATSVLPLLATAADYPLQGKSYYRPKELITIQCLNRTIDTGEHIQDSKGRLQYIPFFSCLESPNPPSPLTIPFGAPSANCTIPKMTDEMFHLFEFYIHADSPLTCRVPARPRNWGDRNLDDGSPSGEGEVEGEEWVPLVLSLAGTIELSHVHIATVMNMVFHTRREEGTPGPIISTASAYSLNPLGHTTRIKIGDPLPLKFHVRWYDTDTLPASTESGNREERGGLSGWSLILGLFFGGALGFVLGKRFSGPGGDGLPMWNGERASNVPYGGGWGPGPYATGPTGKRD